MSNSFRVACVQTNSAREVAANLKAVGPQIERAAGQGAVLVCLPENVTMIEPKPRQHLAKAEPEESHSGLASLREMAARHKIWLLVGSLSVKVGERIANRSYLLNPDGATIAAYDKVHLFDVDLAGGESYRESDTIRAGDKAVIAPTPWGRLGMTICYDLRFPQLYRALAKDGADFIAIPAAFTRTTGRAHWHVLIRARAIETGCYVFAPAQCGEHAEGRLTYGHSLIVSPWGEILADGGEGVGVITADIDPARVAETRRMIPCLRHDRPFSGPSAPLRAAGE